MKKYLVIGNPIEHSISPKLHNYWFKENLIDAYYDKLKVNESDLEYFINKIRNKEIAGANITVPFKEKIIPFIDKLTEEASYANSVNTIYLSGNNIIGDNTDITGFYLSLKTQNLNLTNKLAFILGSGGVTPSIIIALKRLGVKNITVSNRTKKKAEELKKKFDFIDLKDWGETVKANIIINSTSIGLKKDDQIDLNFGLFGSETLFYDVIYNPIKTNFLKNAEERGCVIQNGLMMFVYQAAAAFKRWHLLDPKIDTKLINFLKND